MATVGPRVDTIVAVFNGSRYLGDAIESVLTQTHTPIDITVVDDGSTDDTVGIAEGFGDRVRVVRQPHQGQAAALNTGVARTDGEYVAFLDADDLWEPEKVARQIHHFMLRPDSSYCVTWLRPFLSPEFEDRRAEIDPSLFRDAPGYLTSTLMARRRLFDDMGGFDARLGHANKTEWFLRARQRGVIGETIEDVLVRRRLHTDNMSQRHAQSSLDEYFQLLKDSLALRRGATR